MEAKPLVAILLQPINAVGATTDTDSDEAGIRRNITNMPLTAGSGAEPLRVARQVVRDIRRILDSNGVPPTHLHVETAPHLLDHLRGRDQLSAFASEIAEIVTSMTGLRHEIDLVLVGSSPTRAVGDDTSGSASVTARAPLRVDESDARPAPTKLVESSLMVGDNRHPVDPSVTIGRSSSCDLVLDDSEASRRHAEVRLDQQVLRIKDLGSTNGTRVNEIPVTDWTPLVAGDIISIGTSKITVVIE